MKPRSEHNIVERTPLARRQSMALAPRRDTSLSARAGLQPATVLFATDICENAPDALRVVAGIAKQLGASLHILNVVEPPFFMQSVHETIVMRPANEWAPDAQRELNQLIERAIPDAETTCHVRVGDVAGEIGTAAEELDAGFIVINTTARSPLARWCRGSLTHEIIRQARRPVLVIPNNCITHEQPNYH